MFVLTTFSFCCLPVLFIWYHTVPGSFLDVRLIYFCVRGTHYHSTVPFLLGYVSHFLPTLCYHFTGTPTLAVVLPCMRTIPAFYRAATSGGTAAEHFFATGFIRDFWGDAFAEHRWSRTDVGRSATPPAPPACRLCLPLGCCYYLLRATLPTTASSCGIFLLPV